MIQLPFPWKLIKTQTVIICVDITSHTTTTTKPEKILQMLEREELITNSYLESLLLVLWQYFTQDSVIRPT